MASAGRSRSSRTDVDSANPTKRGKLGAGVINPYKALTQCGFSAGPSPSPPIQVRSPLLPPPRRVNSPPPPSPSQSPIASPPPPSGGGSGSPFTLVPSEPCGLDSRGCVHSPGWPRGYGVSQTCNIRVAPGITSPNPPIPTPTHLYSPHDPPTLPHPFLRPRHTDPRRAVHRRGRP